MPYYGDSITYYYVAWDTSAGGYKTGDSANHTLYTNIDGTAAAATNSPAEVDATNQPGLYKIVLTAAEMQGEIVRVHGKSSTSNVSLHFPDVGPLHLPNAAPGGNGALPTVDANNYIAGIQGTINDFDALDTAQDTQHAQTQSDIAGLENLSAAAVNAEVDTALQDIGLDHLLAASVTGADVTDNSIVAKLVSKSATADWDDFVNTTDSLQALADSATATALLASTVDGVTIQSLFEILIATWAGKSANTDNGDGTQTIIYYYQDGTTPKLTTTYDSEGEWDTAPTVG